jgi:uncharacterized protein (DUF2141 family)
MALFVFGFSALFFLTDRVSCKLTIVAEDVRNAKGVVGVLVFASDRGWPEKVNAAVRSVAAPAQPGITTLTVGNLPPGTYAVVVLHDENENMKLDRNLLGIPKEGWGMSNNPKARVSAPAVRQARFVLNADSRLRIHMNY